MPATYGIVPAGATAGNGRPLPDLAPSVPGITGPAPAELSFLGRMGGARGIARLVRKIVLVLLLLVGVPWTAFVWPRWADHVNQAVPGIAMTIALGLGLLGVFQMIASSFDSPRALRDARARFARVTEQYAVIAAAGRRLPTEEAHGRATSRSLAQFERTYVKAARLLAEAGTPHGTEWAGSDLWLMVGRAKDTCIDLEGMAMAASGASQLLARGPAWRAAWEQECGPLLEDLGALEQLCGDIAGTGCLDVSVEEAWVRSRWDEIQSLTAGIAAGTVVPGRELDALDDMSAVIWARVIALVDAALAADGSRFGGWRRREYHGEALDRSSYTGRWQVAGWTGTYSPEGTIRDVADDATPAALPGPVRPVQDRVDRYRDAIRSTPFSGPLSPDVT